LCRTSQDVCVNIFILYITNRRFLFFSFSAWWLALTETTKCILQKHGSMAVSRHPKHPSPTINSCTTAGHYIMLLNNIVLAYGKRNIVSQFSTSQYIFNNNCSTILKSFFFGTFLGTIVYDCGQFLILALQINTSDLPTVPTTKNL